MRFRHIKNRENTQRVSEKEIENTILTWLNFQPQTFAFKVNTVGVFDPLKKVYRTNNNPFIIKGTSDIICVHRGVLCAIEVKTPKAYRRLTLHPTERDMYQDLFLKKVKASGGIGFIATSLDEVIDYFSKLQPEKLN